MLFSSIITCVAFYCFVLLFIANMLIIKSLKRLSNLI